MAVQAVTQLAIPLRELFSANRNDRLRNLAATLSRPCQLARPHLAQESNRETKLTGSHRSTVGSDNI